MNQMQAQVQEAAATTVDSEGLLTGLLEQKISQRSDFELLLDKPQPNQPEPTMKEKLVRRAIEAIQSGEFSVVNSYFVSRKHTDFQRLPVRDTARACGCAIAALYYAGVQLEVAQEEAYVGRHEIQSRLGRHVHPEALQSLEGQYESRERHIPNRHTPERMVECLKGMLEGQ